MEETELDTNEPLRNLGMDSLVGLQLKESGEADLGLEIPMYEVIRGPSVEQFVHVLLQQLPVGKQQTDSTKPAREKSPINDRGSDIPWLAHRQPQKLAQLRLFCFPYGGGGASLFRNWQQKLSPTIEVCPIQLPGREERFRETPFDDVEQLAETLEEVLMPLLDMPFAFYGHSLGALIAFVFAQKIKHCQLKPVHLFFAAFTAPHLPNTYLSAIKRIFSSIGFDKIPYPPEITSDHYLELFPRFTELSFLQKEDSKSQKELLYECLPMMLSDIRMVDNYAYKSDVPFECPISALGGAKDDRVSVEEMEAWRVYAGNKFYLDIFAGDHFFIHDPDEVLECIKKRLNNS